MALLAKADVEMELDKIQNNVMMEIPLMETVAQVHVKLKVGMCVCLTQLLAQAQIYAIVMPILIQLNGQITGEKLM